MPRWHGAHWLESRTTAAVSMAAGADWAAARPEGEAGAKARARLNTAAVSNHGHNNLCRITPLIDPDPCLLQSEGSFDFGYHLVELILLLGLALSVN